MNRLVFLKRLVITFAAVALGESALAGLPPQASATVTNAAAATEARTYVGRAGDSLNYRIYVPERVEAGGAIRSSFSYTERASAAMTTRYNFSGVYGR